MDHPVRPPIGRPRIAEQETRCVGPDARYNRDVPKATRRPAQARAAAVLADPRWAAVRARDRDATFFYSVSTTGVYCRPSCAARPARPEHVAFHDTIAAAERAGFRACKRCRPDEPPADARRAAVVAALCRLLESSEEMPSLEALAAHVGLSPFHVHRMFKATTGVTPRAYAAAHRAARVRRELEGDASITEAIYGAGYNSSARFYAESTARLGMTPSEYRSGAAALPIRFAVGPCSLGSCLVAATTRGVCAILLGDDPEALIRDLERRFGGAALQGGDAEFDALVGRVLALVERPGAAADLPLDIRGTAFQQRVWAALTKIPAGTTTSYAALAASLGAPGSARAVAQACAANALAIAIPCHRVVRTDGGLSGYRWGLERKRALLDREAAS